MNPKIIDWANAIAKFEGADTTLKNPGDLKFSTLIASWGGERGFEAADGGWIAKFPTYEQGFQALVNFLTLLAEDELKAFHQARTLYSAMVVYAGHPPMQYVNGIATMMGVPLATDVSSFLAVA